MFLRYTWLSEYDGEPVIDPPDGKMEVEDEEPPVCPVQVEQSEDPSNSETHSNTEATQPAEHGEEALVCEHRGYEYIYRMYEAVLLKAVRQQRKREDTYTWQVRSTLSEEIIELM